ncbi:MAG: PilZ domain-containing protein [Rubrivivax sp.]|nr:PilZ domain-containing protein [Rubrivivax sp.]
MSTPTLPEIEDPHDAPGWRASRPEDEGALHTQVLRELNDAGCVLHVGGSGQRGVAATLQLVDVLQQQVVLASRDDGIAVARALQARPVWAAANVRSLRVQFALAAACAAREDFGRPGAAGAERFLIQARWPREIYRTSRRHAPRVLRGPRCSPVARIHHQAEQLGSTREFTVLDLSEAGGALLLPAGMAPPLVGSPLRRIELELDDEHIVFTDALVMHATPLRRGTHRVGCRWQGMPAAGQQMLRRWLAEAGRYLPALAAMADD